MGPEVEATVATSAPVTVRTTAGITMATKGARATHFPRPRRMLIPMAAAAVRIEARSKDCHWRSVFSAFSRVDPPLVVTPVASASWPRMRISPTPNMNPLITDADTNRIRRAKPSRVARSMNAPPSTVRVARVRIGSTGPPFMTSAVVTAAAEVVAITMTVVDCISPPATGPANDAYSPAIGLAPASTAVAIPSGTDPIAPARPAIVSRPHATLAITTLLFDRSAPAVVRRSWSVPVLGVDGRVDGGEGFASPARSGSRRRAA